MTDIQWEDHPDDGRGKYPAMLRDIKSAVLADETRRGKWALLAEFAVDMSARDLSSRLGKQHDEFEFISRKDGDVTNVYCRLREGVTV